MLRREIGLWSIESLSDLHVAKLLERPKSKREQHTAINPSPKKAPPHSPRKLEPLTLSVGVDVADTGLGALGYARPLTVRSLFRRAGFRAGRKNVQRISVSGCRQIESLQKPADQAAKAEPKPWYKRL